jgi:RNA polymerase sigma-70 factor (ECF subfamily)
LEAVYHREARRLYHYLLERTGEASVAEDLTADVFLRLARKRPRFPHEGALRRWLYVTADRLCRDWRRRAARSLSETYATEPTAADGSSDLVEALWLKELVGRLTAEQAEVIQWHFGQDLALTEIAARAGITPEAARSRLYRALRALRVLVEEDAQREADEQHGQ